MKLKYTIQFANICILLRDEQFLMILKNKKPMLDRIVEKLIKKNRHEMSMEGGIPD